MSSDCTWPRPSTTGVVNQRPAASRAPSSPNRRRPRRKIRTPQATASASGTSRLRNSTRRRRPSSSLARRKSSVYPNHSPSRHEAPSGTIGPAARAGAAATSFGHAGCSGLMRRSWWTHDDTPAARSTPSSTVGASRQACDQAGGDEDQRGHRHERSGPPAGPLARRVLRFRRERFPGAVDDEGHRGLIGGDRAGWRNPWSADLAQLALQVLDLVAQAGGVLEAQVGGRPRASPPRACG